MTKTARERMSREAWVKRIGRRASRGLTQMRKLRADGITLVLLDEHNARDEQDRFAAVAQAIGRKLKKRGFFVDVHAYETEQMGGQHMEWINHVILTVRCTEPMAHEARWPYLLDC